MASKVDKSTGEVVHAVSREAQLAHIESLVLSVPEAESGDEFEILARLANATTPDELNMGDGLPAIKDLVGRTLIVRGIARRESDKQYDTAWYLVIDATDANTGEEVRCQTSAKVAMMQLVQLHNMQAFPAWIRVDSKVTRNDMTAINLVIQDTAISK